jgi:hypothetical protein
MIKLTDLLIEIHQEQLEEGWKENILAAVVAASSIFGNAKGQTKIDTKSGTEQSVTKQGPLDINFGTAFPSGRYLIKGETEKILIDKLEEIGNHITKNPSANYKIKIISSESQVPNYDAEKPGRVKLDTGELAKKRATVLNIAIKEFIDLLKKDGALQGDVTIEIAPVLIGKEKFKSNDNKDDPKYTKDQFVKAEVTAIPEDKYKSYSERGERVFMNGKAYAMIFYPTAVTMSKSSAGQLNTAYQDVLLKKINLSKLEKAGRSLNPSINAPDQYTATYKIPWDQWNTLTRGTTTITQNMMDKWEQFRVKD